MPLGLPYTLTRATRLRWIALRQVAARSRGSLAIARSWYLYSCALQRFRLHSAIWATASTHFVTDAYGNMYAPLLPLLIPRLDLSLQTIGVLAMCYQLASSVSQLGFGALADRWRPRVLLMGGPVLSVLVLSAIGSATTVPMLAALLFIGGLGSAAFHPPAAALVHAVSGDRKGLAMATHISAGSLGFAVAPLCFAPRGRWRSAPKWAWCVALPGLAALTYTLRLIRRVHIPKNHEAQHWGLLRPYVKPLGLLYMIVVLRTLTANSLSMFLPGPADAAGHGRGRGQRRRLAVPGREHARRLSRRPAGRHLRRAARDHLDARRLSALPPGRAVHVRMDAHGARLDRRNVPAVHPTDQRHVRPADRAGERRHRVVADDGRRVGRRLPARPGGRPAG